MNYLQLLGSQHNPLIVTDCSEQLQFGVIAFPAQHDVSKPGGATQTLHLQLPMTSVGNSVTAMPNRSLRANHLLFGLWFTGSWEALKAKATIWASQRTESMEATTTEGRTIF
ncbi:MAG: hypothetical protein IPK29_14895 [Betaproteobacteria bacterium]|nr:hypothetical protein [Betaproteobacteria bacterium]